MNALESLFHTIFVVSGIVFVICTCLLFSNVCSRERWEVVYISDQLKNCEKHGGFSWVPNTLVCAAALQMTNILFNWQVHRAEERHLAFTLHGLVFHFVFSLSSVVEFNAGEDHVKSHEQRGVFKNVTEAWLHSYSAVGAIVDFFLIHAALWYALHVDNKKYDLMFDKSLLLYGLSDIVYVAAAVSFVILWAMNLARPATLLEWGLLLLAICLQVIACERFIIANPLETAPKRPFYVGVMSFGLVLYIMASFVSVAIVAPFGNENGLRDDGTETLHTGVAFWAINAVFTACVFASLWQYLK